LDVNYWIEKWKKNDLGFHQEDFEPFLVKYFSDIAPGKVLVPLCGKSRDMIWLSNKGWEVIGVEASPLACRAFFEENGLKFEESSSGNFTKFTTGSITIYCGDFFDLPPNLVEGITAVYDRAALIALPVEKRKEYVNHIIRLASSASRNLKILLIGLEHSPDHKVGPPFSVDKTEIDALYGASFQIKELEKEEEKFLPARNPKFKNLKMFETVYWLQQQD
jgi:thiopurine S-methyltransferase